MDLKLKDVAELLNVSAKTVRRWLATGKIPAYRLNHQYRFSRIEIENWMMGFKQEAAKEGFLLDQDPQSVSSKGVGAQQFSLYRAIHNGGVFPHAEGETKEEIIRSTMKIVAPRLGLDAEVLAELLLDREQLMPTAVGHGIGIPHARDFLLQGPSDTVVVVFPKTPLDYGALDGQPVHTLFFLFSSNDKRHLHLLAKIAHLSRNSQASQLFRSHPSEKKLLDFIRQWEPVGK
ncbi:MAG: PTS sugar transporter subunit IIA [Chlamydiales bacterium]